MERLIPLIHEVGGDPGVPIDAETHFEDDLGIDSLNRVDLVSAAEAAFGVTLSDEEVLRISTVGEMVTAISEAR
jgi:acyl carrier protein